MTGKNKTSSANHPFNNPGFTLLSTDPAVLTKKCRQKEGFDRWGYTYIYVKRNKAHA